MRDLPSRRYLKGWGFRAVLALTVGTTGACAGVARSTRPSLRSAPPSAPLEPANLDSRSLTGNILEVATSPRGMSAALDPAQCVNALLAQDVAFVPLRRSRGIAVPVQIEGPIRGVSYRPTAGFELVVDCRFALVLADVGPALQRHGVTALEFSIAHAYRPTRGGHLSLHANGLALDVHAAVFADGATQSVRHDFSRRLGQKGCAADAKPMNRLACELERSGWFSELLTPDHDRDHADHFHLGVARLR